ncbi:MAG: DUF4405 domain-containing protein [Verrucomicrobia bacterium]|jgi:hypothetical protein|nr:DUF4405 domain-containing protein [Verrucomicrobiota bacterium]
MHHPSRRFQWRALTSVLIAGSFVILVVTGIVLFAAPPGRIANWTNWNILGLRKTEWAGLHIWFSTLFLLVTIFHVAFNWRPMVSYFKDRLSRRIGFRWEWAVALLIVAGVFAGTRLAVPPFSTLLAWNEDLKQSWDSPADRAPIPHAELLTLRELAEKAGVPVETAVARLEARGVKGFAQGTVVEKIAAGAGLSAQRVYEIIVASGDRGSGQGLGRGGQGAGGGPGRKTLEQFCTDESLALDKVLARLAARGITANGSQTLREIAVSAGFARPSELLELIRSNSAQP